MSMKAMLLAAATAATLALPAAAMAQDYHRDGGRYEARGRHDDDRGYRGYGAAPVYGYAYTPTYAPAYVYGYPAYGYDRYAAPVFRDRDDRRGWDYDRDHRDHDRR